MRQADFKDLKINCNLGAHDGVGATIKREATKHSLRQVYDGHILTPRDLFEFAQEHIHNIKVFYVDKEEIDGKREFLEDRFSLAKTIPGTRSFHCFVPANEDEILVKRLTKDDFGVLKRITN